MDTYFRSPKWPEINRITISHTFCPRRMKNPHFSLLKDINHLFCGFKCAKSIHLIDIYWESSMCQGWYHGLWWRGDIISFSIPKQTLVLCEVAGQGGVNLCFTGGVFTFWLHSWFATETNDHKSNFKGAQHLIFLFFFFLFFSSTGQR